MSIGFLLGSRNDSVIWRGPKKTGKPSIFPIFYFSHYSGFINKRK
jgi:hypothetical protein